MTRTGEVAVTALRRGDIVHVQPHQVYRHEQNPLPVGRQEADVQVDCVIAAGCLVVICWGDCRGTCGAVVYDADDRIPCSEVTA